MSDVESERDEVPDTFPTNRDSDDFEKIRRSSSAVARSSAFKTRRLSRASSQFKKLKPKKHLSPSEKMEIEEMFQLFDTDGSGTMEVGEIRILLWALGFQPEKDEVERLVTSFFHVPLEKADEMSLTLDQFLSLMAEKLEERDTPENMMIAFKLFDNDSKGFITLKDIKRAAKEIELPLTEEELEMIMQHLDKDGGGEVTADEWISIMRQRNISAY